MTHSRRLVLQVCIAAALGTGLMNATAQVQGYATEHVSLRSSPSAHCCAVRS